MHEYIFLKSCVLRKIRSEMASGLLASARKSLILRHFSAGKIIFNKPPTSQSVPKSTPNVPGLSSAVVNVEKGLVGPGASKESNYKNPEYFCYHVGSYFEAEVEMLKYRCSQPSSRK